MRTGEKLIGAALVVGMLAGCAPEGASKARRLAPAVRQIFLDCPNMRGQDGNNQAIVTNLSAGQEVMVMNRSVGSLPHEIEVQGDGWFTMSGENLRREPGEWLAAGGYPGDDATIFKVIAGEPGFSPTSNHIQWQNASSAITAFCVHPGLRSPYGNIFPVGGESTVN